MRPRPSFEQTAQFFQNAAVDPTQWISAMNMLSLYSGSIGAVLLPVKGRGPGTPHSPSLEEPYDAYFREGWHLRDERDRGLSFVRRKGIFVDQDLVSKDHIETSDYYRGFLDKFQNNWSATIGFTGPDDEWTLSLQRGNKRGPYEKHEQADLLRFIGPLSQAAALARSVAYTNATAAMDAYESVGCASFLINRFGRVARYNAQAQLLLGDGLELSNGTLRCSHPADNLALVKLLDGQRAAAGFDPHSPQFAIARREPKRPLVIRAVSLTGIAAMIFPSATTILLISDTEKRPPPTSADKLMKIFGLTATEAALVAHLEKERPLPEVATLMNISFETARTHLKRIFLKTQTQRQLELLMLVRRL